MTSKLSILGYITGATIVLASIIKWSFLFPVNTYLAFGIGIGLLVIILSYIYNALRIIFKKLEITDQINRWGFEGVHKRINALSDHIFHNDEQAVKEMAEGTYGRDISK